MISVGGKNIRDPLVLSPMVDVTDAAFRSIALEWDADVTCSEMVSAAGLIHGNQAAWNHVLPWPGETPYGVQFMTGDPAEMDQAIRALATKLQPDFVDLNLGCPAPNILRSCAGGFLLRDPPKAGKIMQAAKAAAEDVGIKDVSVKLRTGPSEDNLTYLQIGEEAEAAGMSWATLHGRTVEQGYSGEANWQRIGKLVDALSIPVIGNGDIRTPADVVRRREETNCAGFFIARAAMHDPTIFRRLRAALRGEADPGEPSLADRVSIAKLYLQRAPAAGVTNVSELRRQVSRFLSGAPGAKKLRVAMHAVRESDEILPILEKL